MQHPFDVRLIMTFVVCLALAAGASWWGQPRLEGSELDLVINLIVTVFSILSGFLIAVITLIGDPTTLRPGSWRAAQFDRRVVEIRLSRQRGLFILYLLTLALVFSGLVARASYPEVAEWIEYGFLFFGTLAFLLSFGLPSMLIRLQRERVEAEIERRRREAGIPEDAP